VADDETEEEVGTYSTQPEKPICFVRLIYLPGNRSERCLL